MMFEAKSPIYGFENIKEMELEKIDDLFTKLSGKGENEGVSFTLINPFSIREYDFEIPDSVKELLSINDKTNLLVLNVIVIQKPLENSLINFMAPFVFNTDEKCFAQVILDGAQYPQYTVLEPISKYVPKEG